MNFLRRAGGAIAERARFWAGSENRAAAVLVVAGFLLTIGAVYASRAIALGVMAAETQQFDERVLREIHAAREHLGAQREAVDGAVRDITALGGVAALALLTIFTAVYLALVGRRGESALTVVVAVGVLLLNSSLKEFFDRPRPLVFERPEVAGSSFPSGHAMSSMAIYVALGIMLARLAPTWSARAFAMGSTVVLALLVAFSRMYLGVHYPTDVAAGALLGLAWALTVLCAAEVFRR